MKTKLCALMLLFLTVFGHAEDDWESDYPLIAGHYELIGRRCESGNLFAGTIIISEVRPNVFTVTRIVAGKTIFGSGKVETTTPDKILIFRMQFNEDGNEMEGSFLWRCDLDNYGRISGYVYPKKYKGEKPGLEALFAKKKEAE